MTAERPVLRVVRGHPTSEELAALVAVVSTRPSAPGRSEPARSRWAAPILRSPLSHGPGAWRSSALR